MISENTKNMKKFSSDIEDFNLCIKQFDVNMCQKANKSTINIMENSFK